MWSLYQTAKTTATRPGTILGLRDPWAAYMFDTAVVTFGILIENAAQEMENIGGEEHPKWEHKYKLSQLLTKGFALKPDIEIDLESDITALKGLDGFRVRELP